MHFPYATPGARCASVLTAYGKCMINAGLSTGVDARLGVNYG